MKGTKLGILLLLVVALEILLLTEADAKSFWFFGRRRRRASCGSPNSPSNRWVNNWRQKFKFKCDTSKSINVWESQYNKCWGDRIHHFECQDGPFDYESIHCSSTYHANDYDRPLAFKCPHNGFIAGVESTYSVRTKDRRFLFRCCHKNDYSPNHCRHTAIQNDWGQPLRYKVPPGFFLVGASSEHQNGKEDRIWKFEICTF